MADPRDYYGTLGISPDADQDEVRKAYRRLARQYHPDVNGGDPESTEKFKQINQAYEILSNPEKRARYDRYGSASPETDGGMEGPFGGFPNFNEIFDVFFGAQPQGRSDPTMPGRGGDKRADLELTLEEAATGTEKFVSVSRLETCTACSGSGCKPGTKPITCVTCAGTGVIRSSRSTFFGTMAQVGACYRCHGRGQVVTDPCLTCGGKGREQQSRKLRVDIPPGADDRTRIRLTGQGEAGTNGGPPGDLYVFVHLKEHPIFQREGRDLMTEIAVSFARAALGGQVEVPTLEGAETIKITPGTQSGELIRMRGKGLPELNRPQSRGDLHVLVRVKTPTHLSERQKACLLEFAEASGEDLGVTVEGRHEPGFFEKIKNLLGRDDH